MTRRHLFTTAAGAAIATACPASVAPAVSRFTPAKFIDWEKYVITDEVLIPGYAPIFVSKIKGAGECASTNRQTAIDGIISYAARQAK